MTCTDCGRQVEGRDRYCPWCGAPQPPPAETGQVLPGPDEGASVEEQLEALRASFASQNAELVRLSQRLSALERGASGVSTQPRLATTPAPPQASAPAALPQSQAAAPASPASGEAAEGPGGGGLSSAVFADWNWEWLLGGNWLARIGVVALVVGVGLFISLAIENGWLGEIERVLLGLAGGLAFLGAGEYFRKRYAAWAQTVTGGGIAILYLSIYGSFALYGLISAGIAFPAFALVTLAGALLSLRHEAMGVAVLSIFGGFATPMLLQDRLPDQRLLLAYVLVLDVGVLALAGFRNWRWFSLLGWAGSLVLFGFWQQELEPSVALAQIGITAIFLIFAGATIASHVLRQQAAGIADLALVTLNAAGYYGISYWLIDGAYPDWLGGFTASLAAFYALLAAACRVRGEAQSNLTLFSAGLCVLFTVIAVPVQLGGPWVSVAWSVEGLVLLWLSFRLSMRELRWAGYVVFIVSAVWLLAVDSPGAFREEFTLFLNWHMLSYGVAILAFASAGYLLLRRRGQLEDREQAAYPVFAVGACALAAIAVPLQLDGVWITVAWAVEALLVLALSGALALREMRWASYGLLAVMLVRLLGFDTFDLDLETFLPVLNWRFLAFAAGIAALYSAAGMLRFGVGRLTFRLTEEEGRAAFLGLLAMANLATLWILSAEILASADSALFSLSAEVSDNVSGLGLSLLWVIYAAVLIVLGVVRQWRWVRLAGLALLAVPVVKVFAYDSRTLEQEYRVIAFLALGLILVAGGLLYQRYSRAVRGFFLE